MRAFILYCKYLVECVEWLYVCIDIYKSVLIVYKRTCLHRLEYMVVYVCVHIGVYYSALFRCICACMCIL